MTRKLGIGLAAALLTMPGCIIVADGGSHSYDHNAMNLVDRHEMDNLVSMNREAELGMGKAEVLGLYPEHLLSLKGSGLVQGSTVEAWRVSAVTRNGDYSFTRWLYFYDGELVELRDDRVDWDDADRLETWQSR